MRTTKTFTLSLPPEMAELVDKIAREEHRTRSELIREALRQYVESRRWKKIRAWGRETARKLDLKSDEDAERLVHAHRSRKS